MTSTGSANQKFVISRRMAFYLAVGLVAIWIAFLYRSVLSSLILGALLAYILHPAAIFLTDKLNFNYKLSAWLIFLTFVVTLVSLTRFSAPIVVQQINTLTRDFQLIGNELINLQPVLENILNISVPLNEIITEFESEINQVVEPNRLFLIIRSATDNLIWVLVTLMTCFYLLLDHKKFFSWITQITPDPLKENLKQMLAEIDLVWRNYLRGQLLMMLIIGIVSGIGGLAVGLPNALLIGVLAGFLELIPSLGPTVSTIIAGATAWTQGSLYLNISNIWFALLVVLIFIIIQTIENTVLIPRIMGKRMKLHPALVFIAIISTIALFGVIAGLIVIPVIASIIIIIRTNYQHLNQIEEDIDLPSSP